DRLFPVAGKARIEITGASHAPTIPPHASWWPDLRIDAHQPRLGPFIRFAGRRASVHAVLCWAGLSRGRVAWTVAGEGRSSVDDVVALPPPATPPPTALAPPPPSPPPTS